MTKEETRQEINYRLERETRYVVAYSQCIDAEGRKLLIDKIEDNEKTLKLLGEYLIKQFGLPDPWERFYKENYWDKK